MFCNICALIVSNLTDGVFDETQQLLKNDISISSTDKDNSFNSSDKVKKINYYYYLF